MRPPDLSHQIVDPEVHLQLLERLQVDYEQHHTDLQHFGGQIETS